MKTIEEIREYRESLRKTYEFQELNIREWLKITRKRINRRSTYITLNKGVAS